MNPVFTQLGLNTAIDYGKYQAIKGGSGSYVDFLLHYDFMAAEEGDESWMSSLFGMDELIGSLPVQALASLDSSKTKDIVALSKDKNDSFVMIDAQVSALKLQLIEGFKRRYEESEKNETLKAAKIAALYSQAADVEIPSRFL